MPMPVSRTSISPLPSRPHAPAHVDAAALGRVAHRVADEVGHRAQQLGSRRRRPARRRRASKPSAWRPGRQRPRVGLRPAPAAAPAATQRSAGGRGLPSSCASVSRSPTSVCMRSVCCASASARACARPRSAAGCVIVSTKPDSTVSGVRISCDTLATKSRRIAVGALALGDVLRQHQLHAVAVAAAPAPTACPCRAGSGTPPARRSGRPAGRRRRPARAPGW